MVSYPPWWFCRLQAALGLAQALLLSFRLEDPRARLLAVLGGLCWAKGWALLERKPLDKPQE